MMHEHQFAIPDLGTIRLRADDEGLRSIVFVDEDPSPHASSSPLLAEARKQLEDYFAGTRTAFDLPLAPEGTDMQKQVWTFLQTIPCGETRSYQEVARAIGRPTASRAVGAANGRNPLWIVIPCHRVIGSNGALTGYAGGIERKKRLLELEARGPLASPRRHRGVHRDAP